MAEVGSSCSSKYEMHAGLEERIGEVIEEIQKIGDGAMGSAGPKSPPIILQIRLPRQREESPENLRLEGVFRARFHRLQVQPYRATQSGGSYC